MKHSQIIWNLSDPIEAREFLSQLRERARKDGKPKEVMNVPLEEWSDEKCVECALQFAEHAKLEKAVMN